MNTDWNPGGKRKINHTDQQPKTSYNRKHDSLAVDRAHVHNFEPNTPMISEDVLALKIHGLFDENDSSSSDSGLSTFDEDYYKHKPQPVRIDPNQIIVIRNRKNTKKCFNPKLKGNRGATFSGQKRGRKNNKKSLESSEGNTPKPPMSVGEIKADNKVKKDEGERVVTKQSNLIYDKGSIFTISDGRTDTIPDISSKNLVKQSTINKIKPSSLAVDALQGPNNKWSIPKPTEVLSNVDLNYARYPPLRGEVVIPDMAKTHLLSSIPSIDSRQSKNVAQINKSFVNDFDEAYNYLRDVTKDLENLSEDQKTSDKTLQNLPGTQQRNKTVVRLKQNGPKVYQQLHDLAKTYYGYPVQDCSQFAPDKSRQPPLSKRRAPMDQSVANNFEQTDPDYFNRQSSHGQKLLNDTLKKPPVAQKRDNAPKINRQFDNRVQLSKTDSMVEQGYNRIDAVKNSESTTPIRPVRPQNSTEGNTCRGSTRISQGNDILRHFPDQSDVIVRQPQIHPISQTTQRPPSTRDESAEHEDDKHLLGEMSEGYWARLRLFCCCSRT